MTDATTQSKVLHPFETPAAEGFFKALLWVVLVLQIAVFARLYARVVAAVPERGQPSHWQAR